MIYELINNDHHKCNCALFKCFDQENIYYKKVSFSDHGNSVIENEKNGYNWYFSAINEKNSTVFIKDDLYEITIPEFEGTYFPFNLKYPENKEIIESLINFYITFYSNKNWIAIHGDFALNNIVLGLGKKYIY